MVDSLIQKSAGLFMLCSVILHSGERYYQPRVQCKTVLAEMTRCDHKRAAFPNAVLTGTILCAPKDWEVSCQRKMAFFFFFFFNGIPVEMSFQKNVLIMEAHQLARTFTVK